MMKKFFKYTNAQAALEFLTTYGWAFLIILIMIGTLAYFGILSPSKILPNRCNFGAELQCLDFQLQEATTNTISVRLKNGIGQAIDVSSIGLSTESTTALSCTPTAPVASYPFSGWKGGNITDFTWDCTNPTQAGLQKGEKAKVLITVRYNSVVSGSAYTREVKGEIFSAVI